ncbi:Uncharacterised protein [Mycobacteroides abscessus subsp. abscessus]|nr:Uncharacterised protein [Mycobacteroides abscessus subsp. abscessus]
MTVAPPDSSAATTDAAIEPLEAPVTTATSLPHLPCSGLSAPAAIRPYSEAWTLRPCASDLPCHQLACVATACPAPSNCRPKLSHWPSISLSSVIHNRARSSRALAQRSSNTTAFLPSNVGATNRGQSEPNSAETSSTSSVSVAPSGTATGADRPSWSSTRRAAEASTPSRPVIWSVNSLSAAASTVAPPPPPAEGSVTPTP